MAADDENDKPAGAEGADAEGGKKVGGKKKLLIIIIAAVLLLGGGGAGVFFSGILGGEETAEHAEEGEHGEKAEGEHGAGGAHGEGAVAEATFVPLDTIKVNLTSTTRKSVFAMISVSLALEKAEDKAAVDAAKPRIVDSFQTYLRELTVDEMRGSAGLLRLREELLLRVNAAVAPVKVRDILFQQVLIQ